MQTVGNSEMRQAHHNLPLFAALSQTAICVEHADEHDGERQQWQQRENGRGHRVVVVHVVISHRYMYIPWRLERRHRLANGRRHYRAGWMVAIIGIATANHVPFFNHHFEFTRALDHASIGLTETAVLLRDVKAIN